MRSLLLDNLTKEQVDILKAVGNEKFNIHREGQDLLEMKPTFSDSFEKKQKFIEQKYKRFYEQFMENKNSD